MKVISGKSEVCSARRRLQSAGGVGSLFFCQNPKATYYEFVLNSCRNSEGRHGKKHRQWLNTSGCRTTPRCRELIENRIAREGRRGAQILQASSYTSTVNTPILSTKPSIQRSYSNGITSSKSGEIHPTRTFRGRTLFAKHIIF